MLLVFLFIFLLIAAIVFIIIADKHFSYDATQVAWIVGILISIISIMGLIISLMLILFTQIPAQKDYEAMLYEKEVLEYRLKNQDNALNGNELLYRDITEFNNDLRDCKYWADNLWLNWFFNQKIATIDYIELNRG